MFDKRKATDTSEPTTGTFSPPAPEPRSAAFNARSAAMIGSTIKIKGDVSGDENLVIEGTVEGSVELPGHDLTIGQSGRVVANLNAKTVKIEGQITGDITGTEKVIISKSGRVQGNIVAPRVTLEDGAKFKGSIDMDPGAESASAAPRRAGNVTKSAGSGSTEPSAKNTAS